MGMGSCGVSWLTDALKRHHHTGKVKALTQKISRHLVLNRDIDQNAQFLDEGDVSNEDSDKRVGGGGRGAA